MDDLIGCLHVYVLLPALVIKIVLGQSDCALVVDRRKEIKLN